MADFAVIATGDGSRTLQAEGDGQAFASVHGAITEAEHVYVRGSGVADRLAHRCPTEVLEIGFGAGLNFLATARAARQCGVGVRYTAFERRPVPVATLRALAYDRIPGMEDLAPRLWAALDATNSPAWSDLGDGIRLRVRIEDARQAALPAHDFDAVYHDPFSPEVDADLWTAPFLARLFGALRPGGVLATYSARGSVRRALQDAGFQVERRPGPPGKREMTRAIRPDATL